MGESLTDFKGLGNEVFIETGTFRGDTVENAINSKKFSTMHSIELDQILYLRAVLRFIAHPQARLYCGSSADILPLVVDRDKSTTFYLDAHKTIVGGQVEGASAPGAECPLLVELDVILSEPWNVPCIVVIDDARMFGDGWWTKGQYTECFDRERWPTTSEIVGRLEAAGLQVSENNDRITGRNS